MPFSWSIFGRWSSATQRKKSRAALSDTTPKSKPRDYRGSGGTCEAFCPQARGREETVAWLDAMKGLEEGRTKTSVADLHIARDNAERQVRSVEGTQASVETARYIDS